MQILLLSVPHRAMFFAGALQLIISMLFWLLELLARQQGVTFVRTNIPPGYLHALLMYFGVFPFFMFGFLLTVFPRWLKSPPRAPSFYGPAWLLMTGGWLLVYAGVFTADAVITVGLGLCVLGWSLIAMDLLRILLASSGTASLYERVLLSALILGIVLLGMAGAGYAQHNVALLRLALDGGLWLFLLPIAFTVGHRMIPFFSGLVIEDYRVYQPAALLLVGLAAMLGYFLATTLRWPMAWLFTLVLAGTAGWLSFKWGLRQSFRVRLLAMLHVAFVWLALASVLFTLQGLMSQYLARPMLGRAPLHAAGIGFLASLIIAFVSRVSLGHSGRALVADWLTWWCFLAFQVVAILRVLADLPAPGAAWTYPLYVTAAGLWTLAAMFWTGRYLPIYLRPRVDGRPG